MVYGGVVKMKTCQVKFKDSFYTIFIFINVDISFML